VTDATNRVRYFNWAENPNIIWTELKNLDVLEAKPVMELNQRNPALMGEVPRAFEEVSKK
jgi:hypothetical protein